ncbi:hypothetical protein [Streptomyces sp. 1222.5]|uniref:hypothetical protein n=1 Tax=Streptomyces sp. 1222.5 TaxID=1881026 RepID=UPI003EBB4461
MTARRTTLLAVYWAVILTAAALASILGALPFTGVGAQFAGVLSASAVGLVGLACAPTPGGAR